LERLFPPQAPTAKTLASCDASLQVALFLLGLSYSDCVCYYESPEVCKFNELQTNTWNTITESPTGYSSILGVKSPSLPWAKQPSYHGTNGSCQAGSTLQWWRHCVTNWIRLPKISVGGGGS